MGKSVVTLYDQDRANSYHRNRATFSPSDDLVLNDGVLWDISSGKPIHKFDKFNSTISGVFHPNGLEIIINSEVVSFLTHLRLEHIHVEFITHYVENIFYIFNNPNIW